MIIETTNVKPGTFKTNRRDIEVTKVTAEAREGHSERHGSDHGIVFGVYFKGAGAREAMSALHRMAAEMNDADGAERWSWDVAVRDCHEASMDAYGELYIAATGEAPFNDDGTQSWGFKTFDDHDRFCLEVNAVFNLFNGILGNAFPRHSRLF